MSLQPIFNHSPPAPVYKVDPIGWNLHYLRTNLHLYREFRRRAREHTAAGKTVRANRIIQELRFETQLSGNDAFKINDHASGLFARIYLLEHRDADVEIQKKGYWKNLSDADRSRIMATYNELKGSGLL